MKKAILLMTMILFVSGTITLNAYAASQSVNVSYKTYGSANGRSNGKTNGVWHYLRNGKYGYLKITSKTGAGRTYASLYRSVVGPDKKFGTVRTSKGSHKFSGKLNKTSGSYYLICYGGNSSVTIHIKGKLHD
ncbi:hypothetical protein [Lactiplantibacillus plantarum]|uniref:hypothetical protein n=1 Tax=Lactiplantibacillus plantarum TaxID=1590 RepID=UPI002043A35B|nr:hypothetical protein [Lactiplantibacillus plantarum]MCM2629885.1 hypothetical protein [Lactiplantibacillus plantarum]MCS6158064.1 hypothetical protein [Lactiplantibacillus plantarum]